VLDRSSVKLTGHRGIAVVELPIQTDGTKEAVRNDIMFFFAHFVITWFLHSLTLFAKTLNISERRPKTSTARANARSSVWSQNKQARSEKKLRIRALSQHSALLSLSTISFKLIEC